jgi:hypothetical protein
MPFEDSLVAISADEHADPVGVGFFISEKFVLTCAHVVNEALSRGLTQTGRPNGQLTVRLHAMRLAPFEAKVDDAQYAWNDPPATRSPGADTCILRILNPPLVPAVELDTTSDLITQSFRTAGFPSDYFGDLDIANGVIVGRDSWGLYMLRPEGSVSAVLSANGGRGLWSTRERPSGIIAPGFSGAPVEVNAKVVGIVAEARSSYSQVTAYMIPMASLESRLPRLGTARSVPKDGSDAKVGCKCQDEGTNDFIKQFSPGPTVDDTHLVTLPLVHAYAELADRHTDAEMILAEAAKRRLDADPSEPRAEIKVIKRFMVSNIDVGSVPFWHECFTRACLLGPRMLASLLVAVRPQTLSEQARIDRNRLIACLCTKYRMS